MSLSCNASSAKADHDAYDQAAWFRLTLIFSQ